MPKVRFIREWHVMQGDGNGPVYKVGDVVDLPQSYADKYKRRQYAVDATDEEETAASAATPPADPAETDPPAQVPATDDPPAPDPMTAAMLLAAIENDPAMKNFMALRAEATKILGDDTPAKKADIIAALQLQAEADAAAQPESPAA